MQVFIFQGGAQEGPYTMDRLQALQSAHQVAPDALAWHEGLAGWVPVAQVLKSEGGAVRAPGGFVSVAPKESESERGLFVEHQPGYSRLQLLMRGFLGWIYIGIPHGVPLCFMGLASTFCTFIAFFAILFTGRYPVGLRGFVIGVMQWQSRVAASLGHLVDGYPEFGLGNRGTLVRSVTVPPETYSRLNILLRVFFGWLFVLIPHGFCLIFRGMATGVVTLVAFFIVLFTGQFPPGMHEFIVGTMRWGTRLGEYLLFLSNDYPPFSGKP